MCDSAIKNLDESVTIPLLEDREDSYYTKDGSVDFYNNPANKRKTGSWKACRFILGTTCSEKMAYFGMTSNLLLYFKNQLNQHSSVASRNLSNWLGTCYVMPLVGAFLCDAYFGGYKTISIFSMVSVCGLTMLTLSASIPGLKPTCYEKDECYATGFQTAACFVSLYLVGIGSGGMRPCLSAFGADQFDEEDTIENSQKTSFFNWFYFAINMGALVSYSILVWIKIWYICNLYGDCSRFLLLGFLDKAAVKIDSENDDTSRDPWRLCTVTQVEELKAILRLLPVWATCIIFCTASSQMSNLFILQGEYMNTRIGSSNFRIPQSSLIISNSLGVIFCVPIYDRFLVPLTRKFTGHKNGLTQLQRIGVGLFISTLAMFSAAILEIVRLEIVKRNNSYDIKEAPISILWQIPQFFIIGCAEVFASIGQLEFFYEEAPASMKSMCTALSITSTALGNYLSSFLVSVVTCITTMNGDPGWIPDNLNYGNLHYFFLMLAVMSVLNLLVFVFMVNN